MRARAALDKLGPAGVISLGVLLFCAFFHFSQVRPLERELAAQRTAAERLKARSPVDIAQVGDKAGDTARFYALFPAVAKLPDELERVYAVARASGLEIQQGEYRLEARGTGLLSYRVAFPIRGTYAQIRQFVGTTLKDLPIASIDALRFERKRVGDTQLEGQVRLTIYFRREAGQDAAPPAPAPAAREAREATQ